MRVKPPKSHNGIRSLVLDSATLTVVTGVRPWGRTALVPGYMFTGRHGQPLRPDNVTDRFNQLAVAAGSARSARIRFGTWSSRICWISGTGLLRWLSVSVTIRRR